MFRLAIHFLALVAAIGCDKPAPSGNAANTPKPSATAPIGFGTIRGKVMLSNWNPPPPAANMVPCGNHQIPLPDEKVVVKNGGLENVVIYLKDAPPSTTTARLTSPKSATPAPAVLDQINCAYVPHVIALRTGQTLTIKSSENLFHNVHTLAENNPGSNFSMTQPGSRDVVFKNAEIFRVKCDVHPWMSAHIAVFDHPFFAVSANGGKFQIDNLPAGPQTLVAWHERFGEIEQTITVTADQTREITFNFQPPNEK